VFVPDRPFHDGLICFTRIGSGLIGLERLARDKLSSLFQTFVNYSGKKFYNIELSSWFTKFFAVSSTSTQLESFTGLAMCIFYMSGGTNVVRTNAVRTNFVRTNATRKNVA
jgi:hypothetical protein